MVFTYIRLKNFLSFGEVTFNFKKNANSIKQFVAIYGENGSGKSNFVRSVDLLCKSLISFDKATKAEEINNIVKNHGDVSKILQRLMQHDDMQNYLDSCRMVDCNDPTEIEYGFLLNGYEGKYNIQFSEKFINESLYYFKEKQRGYLFQISSDNDGKISYKFWPGLFLSGDEDKEVKEDIIKYWGKHTFLSIIIHKMNGRNSIYNQQTISKNLLDVINLFFSTTVIMNNSHDLTTGLISTKPCNMVKDLPSGKIPRNQLPQLQCSERILKDFFTQTYADIKDIYYKIEPIDNDTIQYQLYVDKMIAGKIRHISFENESAGTQQILDIVRMLLGLFCGITVVFDEIDTGIHDVLLTNIISSLKDEISGQLIITTHNTMLLEEIDTENAYVIQVDYLGNKNIQCLDEFPIQNTNNARKQYLKGLFGGTPYIDGIDYTAIAEEIESVKEDN